MEKTQAINIDSLKELTLFKKKWGLLVNVFMKEKKETLTFYSYILVRKLFSAFLLVIIYELSYVTILGLVFGSIFIIFKLI